MNILRLSTLSLAVALAILALAYANPSFAGKKCDEDDTHPSCKDDGGDPPPTGCTDTFPGFLYEVKGTRKLPAELRLSSSDGCRTELVATSTHLERVAFHMTEDRLKGVVVWSEDPEHNFHSIVWRRDFTVDFSENLDGELDLEDAVQILPLVGEEAPEGQTLGYGNLDIWGDASHGLLFLVTGRGYGLGSGSNTKETLIYDLNALTGVDASPAPGVREIYYEDVVPWGGYPEWQDAIEPPEDCNDPDPVTGVPFPRFVASCYRPENLRFNPSGTHIYVSGKLFLMDGRREYAEMRININWNESSDPTVWAITGPEMVYVNGPRYALPRPQSDPLQPPTEDSHEIVMADDQFLDADKCAADYADYFEGDEEPPSTVWLECLVFGLFTNSDTRLETWDSSDSYLFRRLVTRRRDDLFRFYVSGEQGGDEEKLIENGDSVDGGF